VRISRSAEKETTRNSRRPNRPRGISNMSGRSIATPSAFVSRTATPRRRTRAR